VGKSKIVMHIYLILSDSGDHRIPFNIRSYASSSNRLDVLARTLITYTEIIEKIPNIYSHALIIININAKIRTLEVKIPLPLLLRNEYRLLMAMSLDIQRKGRYFLKDIPVHLLRSVLEHVIILNLTEKGKPINTLILNIVRNIMKTKKLAVVLGGHKDIHVYVRELLRKYEVYDVSVGKLSYFSSQALTITLYNIAKLLLGKSF